MNSGKLSNFGLKIINFDLSECNSSLLAAYYLFISLGTVYAILLSWLRLLCKTRVLLSSAKRIIKASAEQNFQSLIKITNNITPSIDPCNTDK